MAAASEINPTSFEIDAEVRYSDALWAGLGQFLRRARAVLALQGLLVAGLAAAAWLTGRAGFGWTALALAILGALPFAFIAWLTQRDYRVRGGRSHRLLFHVCPSGLEIRSAGRRDWLLWDELWDAGETRRSFLLSPSPEEQYVIPKRCCAAAAAQQLRVLVREARALTARG